LSKILNTNLSLSFIPFIMVLMSFWDANSVWANDKYVEYKVTT